MGEKLQTSWANNIKYALLPHNGDWEEGLVQEASNKWNEPLIAKITDGSNSPTERILFEIVDKNLEISSMTIENNDLIVRFYNASSESKPHQIKWNCSTEKIEQIDLNGNFISDVVIKKISDRQFTTEISLPQFGFQTLRLKGAEELIRCNYLLKNEFISYQFKIYFN